MAKAAQKHVHPGAAFLRRQRDHQAEAARAGLEHRKLYNTAAYQRFRAGLLRDRPLCQDCQVEDRLTPATEVHHERKLILHPEDICDERHCKVLCKRHHDQRTAKGE